MNPCSDYLSRLRFSESDCVSKWQVKTDMCEHWSFIVWNGFCVFLFWVCFSKCVWIYTWVFIYCMCVPVTCDIIENTGYSKELVGGVSLSAFIDLAEHMVSILWAVDCLSCVLSAQCQWACLRMGPEICRLRSGKFFFVHCCWCSYHVLYPS